MIQIAINLFDAQGSSKVRQSDPTKGVGPNRLWYENGRAMTNTAAPINYKRQILFLVYLRRVITIEMCERV